MNIIFLGIFNCVNYSGFYGCSLVISLNSKNTKKSISASIEATNANQFLKNFNVMLIHFIFIRIRREIEDNMTNLLRTGKTQLYYFILQ